MGTAGKYCWILFVSFLLLAPQRLIAQDSSRAVVLYNKGLAAFAREDFKAARDLFGAAHKLNPNDPQNRLYLGRAEVQLGNSDEAEEILQKLLEQFPNYAEAYFDLGFVLYSREKYAEALRWLDLAIEKKPSAQAYYYGALASYQLDNTELAIERLRKVTSLYPESELAGLAEGWLKQLAPAEVEERRDILVERKKRARRWHLKTQGGFHYDTNVIQDPEQEALTGFTNQNDYLATGSLLFRYLFLEGKKTKLAAEYSGYQSVYTNIKFDSNSFNYGRQRGGIEWTRRLTDYVQWRLPLYYVFSTLGKAKYVQSATVEGILDAVWAENWMTTVMGGIRRDDFFASVTNAGQNRDASQPYAQIEQYFFAPNNRNFYAKAGYGFETNLANGPDWDFNAHHIYLGLQIPLMWRLKLLMLTDIVARRNFENVDTVFNASRVDQSATSTAVLSKEITPHFGVQSVYTFHVTDSSLIRFTHKRHVLGFVLELKL